MRKNEPAKKDEIVEDQNNFINETLWKIINRHDRLFESTNTKAALIIAFNTFVFGGIILKWREILPDFNDYRYLAYWGIALLTVSVLFSIGSLLYTISSVKPFLESSPESILFFKAIAKKDVDAYYNVVKEMSDDSLNKDLAEQTYILSRGISEKFDRLKIATWLSVCQLILLGLLFEVKFVEFLSENLS